VGARKGLHGQERGKGGREEGREGMYLGNYSCETLNGNALTSAEAHRGREGSDRSQVCLRSTGGGMQNKGRACLWLRTKIITAFMFERTRRRCQTLDRSNLRPSYRSTAVPAISEPRRVGSKQYTSTSINKGRKIKNWQRMKWLRGSFCSFFLIRPTTRPFSFSSSLHTQGGDARRFASLKTD